ncbi:MAG: 4Fe-4S binding protein, partial [Synergistaceae bacterium]|nr:4Fe-4S binding protein [Synergistaceae bacterium]
RAAKLPMLEPSDSQEALDFFKKAYEISEEFDVPVIVKMCTRVAHSQSLVEIGERDEDIDIPYEKNIAKYVMMPGNAIKRHPIVEERMRRLRIYSDFSKMNKFDDGKKLSIGIITSSTCYQYVKEACGDLYPVFKIGMVWPLPDEKIKEFAKVVKRLIIVEELDPFIEEHCKALGLKCEGKELFPVEGELNQNIIAKKIMHTKSTGIKLEEQLPARPPMMCAGCPHRGIFYTLNKNNCIVLGDIGCYTLGAVAPLSAMDMTLCMGASVSAVHGFNKALENYEGDKKVVAVIGDSTFMHSGMTGLANIAYNQSKSVVIILDNSITGMTGHQQNPTTGFNIKGDPAGKINLENLCKAMGFNRVRVVDPYNLKECEDALKEELAANEASVIISRRPCALLKYVKHNPPLKVNTEKCVGCKSCMKIGCPALSIKDKHAHVDSTLCVGCGVCEQLCKFDAFEGTTKEGE